MTWNLFGGLMPPEADTAVKSKDNFGDSGNCSEAEEEQNTNRASGLEFQLTQHLLSQMKAGKNNKKANSGKQAQLDLSRMNFVINGKTIGKEKCVLKLYGKNNCLISSGNENYRLFAKQVLTGMFKYAEAEVPNDPILEELVTNCNQAGYDESLLMQLVPIFVKYDMPSLNANDREINIVCNNLDSLDIQYRTNISVFDCKPIEVCKLYAVLEFTLKSQNGAVEYEGGKVTLTIPKQLKDCKADGKKLLDEINEHFEDKDNKIIESFTKNIVEGTKSFIADDLPIIEASTQDTESSKITEDHHHSGDSQLDSFQNNSWEVIEYSDLDEIPIAGFSKQELLEMCNFCKISYGNNDEKLDGRYKTKAKLIEEGYDIIPFYNKENGKCAGFVFTKDREITIAYRGTQNFDDMIIDAKMAFTSGFLPDDVMMHSGFYKAFEDSWSSLGKILSDYAKEQGSEIKDFRINCTGHSMGGALANIAALYLKKIKGTEHVRVATFGSPRVFNLRGAEVYEEFLGKDTIRVANLSDPIPMFPNGFMGFKHVGKPLKIKTGNLIINSGVMNFSIVGKYYHKTDTYYNCIQDIKPEDFQPDNDVSKYYYLSYVIAGPYYVITTVLTAPYCLAQSAISNTEQCYFEREMKFDSDWNLISLEGNKSGLVVTRGGAMVNLQNPLVTSYIESLINRRNKGLSFNVSASLINNYYLNGNNIKLRQLCGIENVSVKGASDSTGTENHAPGSKNTISDLVNELALPGQATDRASDKRSQSLKPKNINNQPINVLTEEGKSYTINNIGASIEQSIGNNYVECMSNKRRSSQNRKKKQDQSSDKGARNNNHDKTAVLGGGTPVSPTGHTASNNSVVTNANSNINNKGDLMPSSNTGHNSTSSQGVGGTSSNASNDTESIVQQSSKGLSLSNAPTSSEASINTGGEVGQVSEQTASQNNDDSPIQPEMAANEGYGKDKNGSCVSEQHAPSQPAKPTPLKTNDGKKQDAQQELSPAKMPPVTNKESNQMNNAVPQSARRGKLPIVATSALAITVVAAGIAVAVYLEMLAVGVAVAACCLAAAAVIYYCTPKSQIEGIEIEKSVDTRGTSAGVSA